MDKRAFRIQTLKLRRRVAVLLCEQLNLLLKDTVAKQSTKASTHVKFIKGSDEVLVKLYDESYTLSHTLDDITITHSYRYANTDDIYVVIADISINIFNFYRSVTDNDSLTVLHLQSNNLIKDLKDDNTNR